jgi:hypothetical protein
LLVVTFMPFPTTSFAMNLNLLIANNAREKP